MRRAEWGEVAQVFLGAALALPPALLTWVFLDTSRHLDGRPLHRAVLLALAVFAVVVIAAVATAPPVRAVEVAAARTLLRLDLPDPVAPRALEARLRGAAWVAVCALVGGLVLVALLFLLPAGAGLVAAPFLPAGTGGVPAWAPQPGTTGAWWLVPVGVVALLLAWLVVVGAGAALRRWAAVFLSPVAADRVVLAVRRERQAAASNRLARELHDTVGHALTAMTLNATAASTLLVRDPAAAARHLDLVQDTGREALAELDEVLGSLRVGGGDVDAAIARSVERLGATRPVAAEVEELGVLPPEIGRAVVKVVAEGLTNAGRYAADGPVRLSVRRVAGPRPAVEVVVRNPVTGSDVELDEADPRPSDPAAASSGTGRGLVGIRERVVLLGGELAAGLEEAGDGAPPGSRDWTLRVRMPLDAGEQP